jgi:hypothetical protein
MNNTRAEITILCPSTGDDHHSRIATSLGCGTLTKEVATRHCAPGGTPAFGENLRFLVVPGHGHMLLRRHRFTFEKLCTCDRYKQQVLSVQHSATQQNENVLRTFGCVPGFNCCCCSLLHIW